MGKGKHERSKDKTACVKAFLEVHAAMTAAQIEAGKQLVSRWVNSRPPNGIHFQGERRRFCHSHHFLLACWGRAATWLGPGYKCGHVLLEKSAFEGNESTKLIEDLAVLDPDGGEFDLCQDKLQPALDACEREPNLIVVLFLDEATGD